ncbi:hypothetical protein Q8A73_001182 [Channa argus]|nr:hypothetical protein Q8A73_001182 [Channa argus]
MYLLQMEMHCARYSSHHDCPFISFEPKVGQMVKWVDENTGSTGDRAFVNEKLTAAVDEIFQVFKSTISKYEEEASSSKQEIERLRGLLQEFVSNQKTAEACQSFICKAETPPQQYHSELELCLSIDQRDPESQHIKKEDIEEFKDANALYPTCLPKLTSKVKGSKMVEKVKDLLNIIHQIRHKQNNNGVP